MEETRQYSALRREGRAAALIAGLAFASEAGAETVPVPSGQAVEFVEVVRDAPGLGLAYRFRFVAPEIAGAIDYKTAATDMIHLCQSYALPRLPRIGATLPRVVISLSDRPTEFGDLVPDATQFFEIYRAEGEICVWDGF
ncbi:DUF6497 family protein [Palleronia sp. LCG004]|uniref:DUF6497 family protein n=1 Tax=Palleronia sp. LCG004 TaxID=3079304 RepID=UPI0029420765|nr:DUF6497 family protein [Palleronia sp. LCG004]WOI55355.1 DUF6497 family protein [Palleronia sp. LCG004]